MASHPRVSVKACIDCGIPGRPGDGLSWRGLCVECAVNRHAESVRQMAEKRGPQFAAWQDSVLDLARQILRERESSTTPG